MEQPPRAPPEEKIVNYGLRYLSKAVTPVESQDPESKAGQRAVWALGDYHRFARRLLWGFGQDLVEACGIGPGQRVLDVATGTGNVAIRAALAGAEVVASDLTPENFEAGRLEAAEQGVVLEWVEADAEALPFADAEFDVVTSAFGAVFAPDQQAVADELVRVCRPGGTIGLTVPALPERKAAYLGMLAEVPAMFGAPSPMRWGDEAHVRRLFGERVASLEMGRRRSELSGFANEKELRDFLKTHHPVAVALGREAAPSENHELEDAFLDAMVNLWYGRDGDTFIQEAVLIVARRA
jgi:ubiquinone/menaquinone biosynthesis C-methylase UbiE